MWTSARTPPGFRWNKSGSARYATDGSSTCSSPVPPYSADARANGLARQRRDDHQSSYAHTCRSASVPSCRGWCDCRILRRGRSLVPGGIPTYLVVEVRHVRTAVNVHAISFRLLLCRVSTPNCPQARTHRGHWVNMREYSLFGARTSRFCLDFRDIDAPNHRFSRIADADGQYARISAIHSVNRSLKPRFRGCLTL
ncbi:hypothetical protein Tam10B_0799 [Bifidobacterium vansinderenii]|uniref:Uncharacterized protein n=1 Tax=Bifidobacterium vansinderenii TaxID=1984871 RepID=A0A229VYZ1_9BIFI|nr:hypothetical protein Tam10B_0799 [Bifidobacterium vansinderenii]